METTTNEQQRTKETVLNDFANTVLNAKYSFIMYNTLLNRLQHTYKEDLDINMMSNEERAQFAQVLGDIQFNLLNAQIYYRSVCKKKGFAEEDYEKIINNINEILKEYVPDRDKVKDVVMDLNDFLVTTLSADLQSDLDVVKGVIRA